MAEVDQRELRQLVDRFLMDNKGCEFTIQQIAKAIGAPDVNALSAALAAVVRCPFGSCQSLDTTIAERYEQGSELHHCNRCNRNFHVQRDKNGYSILGWYGE